MEFNCGFIKQRQLLLKMIVCYLQEMNWMTISIL